jgi:hypothetical protein
MALKTRGSRRLAIDREKRRAELPDPKPDSLV